LVCSPKQGNDQQKADAAAALVAVLEAVRIVAVLLAPVTPALSARVLAQLGLAPGEAKWENAAWGGLAVGHTVAKAQPVFARLEGDFVINSPPAPEAAAAAAPVAGK